jgi:hypothetical protein
MAKINISNIDLWDKNLIGNITGSMIDNEYVITNCNSTGFFNNDLSNKGNQHVYSLSLSNSDFLIEYQIKTDNINVKEILIGVLNDQGDFLSVAGLSDQYTSTSTILRCFLNIEGESLITDISTPSPFINKYISFKIFYYHKTKEIEIDISHDETGVNILNYRKIINQVPTKLAMATFKHSSSNISNIYIKDIIQEIKDFELEGALGDYGIDSDDDYMPEPQGKKDYSQMDNVDLKRLLDDALDRRDFDEARIIHSYITESKQADEAWALIHTYGGYPSNPDPSQVNESESFNDLYKGTPLVIDVIDGKTREKNFLCF